MSVTSLTAIINELLPEPHAGLLAGIMFGTKATISKELTEALITTGTLHIIALSGMNITIIASVVEKTITKIISRRISSLITIVLIILFVWFVGLSPSIIRAAIMGTINLFAISLGKERWALYGWCLAVGGMVLLHFQWITDISFQLSALASLGIILFGTKIGKKTEKYPAKVSKTNLGIYSSSVSEKFTQNLYQEFSPLGSNNNSFQSLEGSLSLSDRMRDTLLPIVASLRYVFHLLTLFIEDNLRVTLAAQSLTIPIFLFQFHRLSLVSPLSNILIGWTIAPITILGWVLVTLAWVWYPLGQIVGWVTWLMVQYLVWIVQITSSIPFASLSFN